MSTFQKKGRIYPIHLSSMEKFMLLDDRPDSPMVFFIELTMLGTIDKDAWEQALALALSHQPLLTAILGKGKGGKRCWLAAHSPVPRCDWANSSLPLSLPLGGEGINLAKETGLRVWIRQSEERAVVTLQFHHACTDGIGAYRFIGELLAAYGIVVDGPGHHAISELDSGLLRGRQRRALGREVPFHWKTVRRIISNALRMYRKSPVKLARPKGARVAKEQHPFPGYVTHSFDRATHQILREKAAKRGAVLNDLLIRDLVLTMKDWQSLHGPKNQGGRLGIMMATDLRDTVDLPMPATNMVGYTFLRWKTEDCQNSGHFLEKVVQATQKIKQNRSGTDFLEILVGAAAFPWVFYFLMPTWWSLATVIFSNVADPSRRFTSKLPREGGRVRAGNLILEDITGIPPFRPGSPATISIFQYDRRLTICMRLDPKLFRIEDSRELLNLYVERLKASSCTVDSMVGP